MKFKKFVKSLGTDGVIYETSNGDRWLATASVFMRIPDGVQSVTGCAVRDMPENIERITTQIGRTADAVLWRAIMPQADSAVKDCIRVFKAHDALECPISNDAWTLIEKGDMCEIMFAYDLETSKYEAKALLVKRYPDNPADDDIELVGIIFPVNIEI